MNPGPGFHITERALAALRREGLEPESTVLVIQYALGCGGAGYRLVFSTDLLEDGENVVIEGGVTLSMDSYSARRLQGAAIDYDEERGEGFFLDHEDAASAAFC